VSAFPFYCFFFLAGGFFVGVFVGVIGAGVFMAGCADLPPCLF